MNDEQIVRLYWERKEQAISESSDKYGAYCSAVAGNILSDHEDVKECVNDTWLKAWNSMPPNKPSILSAFFGKITRNLSFNRYKELHREKRGGKDIDQILDELEDCISGHESPEEALLENELKDASRIQRLGQQKNGENLDKKRTLLCYKFVNCEYMKARGEMYDHYGCKTKSCVWF